jgi:hypothetical protein
MNENPELVLQLDVGLKTDSFFAGEALIGQALNLDFVAGDDLELGGIYFFYQPKFPPDTGITEVRYRRNQVEGIGWSVPYRRDLAFVAEITMVSTNLIELGRMAAAITDACGDTVSPYKYVVSRKHPFEAGGELWRTLYMKFESDEKAAPRWNKGFNAPSADSTFAFSSGAWSGDDRIFMCHLTFGFRTDDLAEAKSVTRAIFDVSFEERRDQSLGGRYLEYSRPSAPSGELSSLLLRPNTLNKRTWLYPERKESSLLLDLTLFTSNLLELGRIAAAVEAQCGDALQAVAYRVVGDLYGDRVPRMLEREFSSAEEAAPTWCLGHERHEEV